MTKRIALLTVHGMGETDPNYSLSLQRKTFDALRTSAGLVAFEAVYYQLVLQPNENAVWSAMPTDRLRYSRLRQFLLYGFADAAGLETNKDDDGSVYELAQLEIARKLWLARMQMDSDGPVVIIAQSLGCQVISCYLYDAQCEAAGFRRYAGIWKNIDAFSAAITGSTKALSQAEIAWLRGSGVAGLITTGCNIPIFVAAHPAMQIKAIAKPTPGFSWLNLYDPHDPLGWPLRPLNGGYEQLVEDREIHAGQGAVAWLESLTPLAHTRYWEDDDVIGPLTAMIRNSLAGMPLAL